MDFYERFESLCAAHDPPISPSGLELEKLMKAQGAETFTRSTAGKWKENQNIPRCDFIIALAHIFETSTDYLLGLTEDGARYSNTESSMAEKEKRLLRAFSALDESDQSEIIQYIEFKANRNKYKQAK